MFKALCYQTGGTTYTLQITDVFYIPLTLWCGPLQSCVQGTVLSDRRHYLHTADNRCILHTSNTLVGPLQSCVQGTVLSGGTTYTLQITGILHTSNTLVRTAPIMCSTLCYQAGTTYTLQITCILHTSNTLVRTAPIMCSRHCVIRQEALLTHCR